MDVIASRIAARLRYLDPLRSLRQLRAHRDSLVACGAPQSWVDARTRARERERFSFQAAFFAYLCSMHEGDSSLCYALWEDQQSDTDCVFRRSDPDGRMSYEPVQLKELPSIRPMVTINSLLEGLAQTYVNSSDLRVGVFLNRDENIRLNDLVIAPTRLASLWLFGLDAARKEGCFLCGNLLNQSYQVDEFLLPRRPQSLTELAGDAYVDD